MPARDHQHNPDPYQKAARIVRESTGDQFAQLPHDVETAWQAWICRIQNIDQRAFTLLRAAFEAGWDAGRGK